MTLLTVYYLDGTFHGSEIEWARSGSGFYQQTKLIELPQSREEIIAFARAHGYKIQWRGPIPNTESAATSSTI